MGTSKYKYRPEDVALVFMKSDFNRKQENDILLSIFQNYNSDIVSEYRNDLMKFRKAVHEYAILYSLNSNDYNEVNLIMSELGFEITDTNLDDVFGAYFRYVKLKLIYTDIGCYRLKLRTLLKDFGYKRRSAAWNESVNRALKALDLQPYLKNYEQCNLAEIKVDQMVMIRLKGNTIR